MKRLFFWIVGLPAAVLLVVLSIANKGSVVFSLDPFFVASQAAGAGSALSINVPLFLLLFGAGFLGLLVGWMVGWSGQRRWRREARRLKREVARLQSAQGRDQQQPVADTGRALVTQPGTPAPTKLAS